MSPRKIKSQLPSIEIPNFRSLFLILVSGFYKSPPPKYFSKVTLIDRVFEKTLLKIIPNFVWPNHLTVLRYLSVPFIIYFLWTGQVLIGGTIFLFSALTDALDGALARTRGKITNWGIIHDPLADKLLIGSVAVILVTSYISFYLALVIVGIEATIIAYTLYQSWKHKTDIVPAKLVGKLKMIFQFSGLFLIVVFALTEILWILSVGTYILYVAVVLGLLSLFVYKSI